MNYKARFIELASEINSSMPEYWVDKVWASLNELGRSVRGASILVLGVAYKPDIDDVRESPALDIIALLQAAGAEVTYHDPYVPKLAVPAGEMESTHLTTAALQAADAVVIVTDHKVFDQASITASARLIISARGTNA